MGCDIHSTAEVRRDGRWHQAPAVFTDWDGEPTDEPFGDRSYSLFGFLADVRNYSQSPVIAEPRGLPEDVTAEFRDWAAGYEDWYHSHSWLTLAELQAYDYEQVFHDQRGGEWLTVREFLCEGYFETLDRLAELGEPQDVRIVFCFDN